MAEQHRPYNRMSLGDEIAGLDAKLVAMLAERTRLLAKSAAGRLARGGRAVDPEQERSLRLAWDEAAGRNHLDKALLRRVFTMLNGLAYQAAERPGKPGAEFLLRPRVLPAAVDARGLASQRHAAFLLALAGATGQPVTLGPLAVADPLAELVKAFNQAGAKLSWDADQLVAGSHGALTCDGSTIFVGDAPLTLYILLALALPNAGRVSFTGGVDLKLLDLSPLMPYLTALGARLAIITPNTRGLPARLESGERMATSLALGADCPPDFAAALALAAWSYPEGLTLEFSPGSAVAEALSPVATVLRQCGVPCRLQTNRLTVPHAEPKVPAQPELPLDPWMAATLLAVPRICGGRVRLAGRLPEDMAAGRELPDLLAATGVQLAEEGGALVATAGEWPAVLELSPSPLAGLEFLALALATACPQDAALRLAGSDTEAGADVLARVEEFLRAVGKPYDVDGPVLRLQSGFTKEYNPLLAETPRHALALALVSFARPGLILDNPGVLTTLWPGFWPLYNRLAAPVEHLTSKKDTPDDEPKSGTKRRIIIG